MPARIFRLLCWIVLMAATTPALAENKLAFVVGVNLYPNLGAEAQLQRAVADATAVGDTLQGLGYQVTRITKDAKLETIVSRFEAFIAAVQPGDTIVFYYAGHGVSLDDGNYLIPADIPLLGPRKGRARSALRRAAFRAWSSPKACSRSIRRARDRPRSIGSRAPMRMRI